MKYGQLRDHFRGVGAKRLTAVDAEPNSSNQHEIGTTAAMRREFLGEGPKSTFPAVYIWLGRDQDAVTVHSWATYYDAREHQPDRAPEWRLYYPSNAVTETMNEGDALFLALDTTGSLYFIIAPPRSTSEDQLSWLFGVEPRKRFEVLGFRDEGPELDFAAHFILDELGIEFEEPDASSLDTIIEPLGTTFPPTATFSKLARDSLQNVSPLDDPDAALLTWLSHEEALFRRLERRIVADRLETGFVDTEGADVDGFIRFSLSVQNRRKSRMGHSLEHHLEAVFIAHNVRYVRGAVTESRQRPDFLFPSLEDYEAAPLGGAPGLHMLGAKSTCKDRWRQVLVEAAKIPRKHLLTLEPSISSAQTNQMAGHDLQLVVPQPIHATYTPVQRHWLWTLDDFIGEVQ
ncbi:MAG: type II restriction endonuclease [Rhodospirillaceae bacterium]|nr:type II restriction endonuclease [Rhodospirillaceae bacterium]